MNEEEEDDITFADEWDGTTLLSQGDHRCASSQCPDHRWRSVECSDCKREYVCSPEDDYYRPREDLGAGFVCFACLRIRSNNAE